MIYRIFSEIFFISVYASLLILSLFLLKTILKEKFSPVVRYITWLIVAAVMLIPISSYSGLNLKPTLVGINLKSDNIQNDTDSAAYLKDSQTNTFENSSSLSDKTDIYEQSADKETSVTILIPSTLKKWLPPVSKIWF